MAILRVESGKVGPFQSLNIDLANPDGSPHLGPHIFCGVNGSGKSTILKTIGAAVGYGRGFRYDEFEHLLDLSMREASFSLHTSWPHDSDRISVWTWRHPISHAPFVKDPITAKDSGKRSEDGRWQWYGSLSWVPVVACYGPIRQLDYLSTLNPVAKPDPHQGSLAWNTAIDNNATQRWWVSAFSKEAISRARGASNGRHKHNLEHFQAAASILLDEQVTVDVDIDSPEPLPRVRFRGHDRNLAQLPDGVRTTLGWIADFLRRQDIFDWEHKGSAPRHDVLMIDEIDAHLHPQWQRRILPAMREALPDVQILVTTHSPFVINSCPEARIHVCELDRNGVATVRAPIDAPVGVTVSSTIHDIFDVASNYDIKTEAELRRWDELRAIERSGPLDKKDARELRTLTRRLKQRSESLASLVEPPSIPKSLLDELLRHQ